MKKILSILLAAVMVAAMAAMIPFGASAAAWDGEASAPFTGSGTNSDPYVIASAENLKYLQLQVAGGTDFGGKYITQTADIDLGGKEWTPIGTSAMPFCGVYDGLNHSINGLFISKGDISATGLFGYINSNYLHEAGVMNLTVGGEINIPDLTVDAGIGAIVGWLYKDSTDGYLPQKAYNLVSNVNFTINANAKQPRFGGVFGYVFNSEVTNVTNNGNIDYVGSGNTRIGGIVGQTNRTTYVNCVNNGYINCTITEGAASAQAAGMGGMITYKVDSLYTVFDHCVNNGAITCVAVDGGCYAGGIVSAIYTSATDLFLRITDCVNTAAISATCNNMKDGRYAYAAGMIPRIAIPSTEVVNCVNTTLDINSSGLTGDFAAGIVSDITKGTADTVLIKDNTTVTYEYVKQSVFEVPAGKYAATDGEALYAADNIRNAIPAALADAKIDGFPGKEDPTTAAQTTSAPEPTAAPTAEPTAAPTAEPTDAPVDPTNAPENTNAPETKAAEEKKGCKSSAAACAIVLVAVLGSACVAKKH